MLMAVRVDRPGHAGRRGKVVVRRVEIFGRGRGDERVARGDMTQDDARDGAAQGLAVGTGIVLASVA